MIKKNIPILENHVKKVNISAFRITLYIYYDIEISAFLLKSVFIAYS
jgi:hypothetical protein